MRGLLWINLNICRCRQNNNNDDLYSSLTIVESLLVLLMMVFFAFVLLCFVLFFFLFYSVLQVRLFWGEGAGTIWQVDKLDTDAVIMADIKQDELWVDLLFDGTASFYLALAESKRFRLGLIRNGKISYRLYPKRKDFVSLNVAIKNLAAMQ